MYTNIGQVPHNVHNVSWTWASFKWLDKQTNESMNKPTNKPTYQHTNVQIQLKVNFKS